MTEIAAASTRPRRRWVGLLGRETPRRARLLVMAAVVTVAAAAMATVATLPALQSPDRPPAGVTLVAFSTPVFPLALHPVPSGLTGPFFSGGVGSFIAVYLDTHHSDV
jgi:hypothetical protein